MRPWRNIRRPCLWDSLLALQLREPFQSGTPAGLERVRPERCSGPWRSIAPAHAPLRIKRARCATASGGRDRDAHVPYGKRFRVVFRTAGGNISRKISARRCQNVDQMGTLFVNGANHGGAEIPVTAAAAVARPFC